MSVKSTNNIEPHVYVYGGYEVGSGGPIWCNVCGEDVSHESHIRDSNGEVKE